MNKLSTLIAALAFAAPTLSQAGVDTLYLFVNDGNGNGLQTAWSTADSVSTPTFNFDGYSIKLNQNQGINTASTPDQPILDLFNFTVTLDKTKLTHPQSTPVVITLLETLGTATNSPTWQFAAGGTNTYSGTTVNFSALFPASTFNPLAAVNGNTPILWHDASLGGTFHDLTLPGNGVNQIAFSGSEIFTHAPTSLIGIQAEITNTGKQQTSFDANLSAPVPVPAPVYLLGSALLGLASIGRRGNKA